MMGFGMMGFFGNIFPIFFFLFFFVVMGVIIASLIRSVRQWKRNNDSPVLTVDAQVVSRRSHYRRGSGNHMGHTSYYVTFQVESGDRMELYVSGEEYGMLVEGDQGRLTFQGTRYLGFQRN